MAYQLLISFGGRQACLWLSFILPSSSGLNEKLNGLFNNFGMYDWVGHGGYTGYTWWLYMVAIALAWCSTRLAMRPKVKNWLRLSFGARYTSSHQRNSSIAKWSKEKGGSVFVLGQDSPVLVTAAVARLGLGQDSLVLATEIMAQFLMQHWRGKAPCKERGAQASLLKEVVKSSKGSRNRECGAGSALGRDSPCSWWYCFPLGQKSPCSLAVSVFRLTTTLTGGLKLSVVSTLTLFVTFLELTLLAFVYGLVAFMMFAYGLILHLLW